MMAGSSKLKINKLCKNADCFAFANEKSLYCKDHSETKEEQFNLFRNRTTCRVQGCYNGVSVNTEGFCEGHKLIIKEGLSDNIKADPLPKVIQDQMDVSPLHYRKGEIQPWDFIISQKLGYLEGNIIKYITRHRHKDGLKDLKKAKTYLEKLISIEEKKHVE